MSDYPRYSDGRPVPPPVRIVIKGGLRCRELTYAEAEAHELRNAAALALSTRPKDVLAQETCLEQADINRRWRLHAAGW